MKPVAVFRVSSTEGPGYFARYLDERGLPWQIVRVDAGDPLPHAPSNYAGLVFMGGPMSVNDDLPWIPHLLALIARAVDEDVPVLGHCLGGQLMSKALGGSVTPNPVKEIGWGTVRVEDSAAARDWFGPVREFLSFHWHGETFTVPQGAVRLASSDHCDNQAFALGRHLGMQCHVEMTPEMIRKWYTEGADEIRGSPGPAVQSAKQMEEQIGSRLQGLNGVAERLYDRWITGLQR
jgi:GMP synthase-like glutamine amidotransferase